MSTLRRPARRVVVALMATLTSLSVAMLPAKADSVPVPAPGAWHGSLNWSEDFSGAAGSFSANYCGTTVTDSAAVDWNESVSLSPFSFTLNHVGYVSTPTAARGSLSFTVTVDVPATTNGAMSCPAETATSSGSFSGSGMTTVTGEPQTDQINPSDLSIVDFAAGAVGTTDSGWAGELTQTSPDINNGKPAMEDMRWFPHIALSVEIGTDDTGSWGGALPGTDSFQRGENTSDSFIDSGGEYFYYYTPAFFGLYGTGNAKVIGPGTKPVAPPVIKAPITTITHGPKATTSATTATFRFTSNQTHSTFDCYLDKAQAKPCTSPKTYKNLAKGKHTVHVFAVNKSGKKDPTPAHRSWKILKHK